MQATETKKRSLVFLPSHAAEIASSQGGKLPTTHGVVTSDPLTFLELNAIGIVFRESQILCVNSWSFLSYARIFFTTSPLTSVSLKSRPWKR